MTAYVFATRMEAGPFLKKTGAVLPEKRPEPCLIPLPRCEDAVLITGMGSRNAKKGLEWFFATCRPAKVINAGIAGALSDAFAIGELLAVKEARLIGEPAACRCIHFPGPGLKGARLVTVHEPLFDPVLRGQLAADSDIVDMEGAVYASVCEKQGIPFCAIKCVSDMAGRDGREDVLKQVNRLSEKIAGVLHRYCILEIG